MDNFDNTLRLLYAVGDFRAQVLAYFRGGVGCIIDRSLFIIVDKHARGYSCLAVFIKYGDDIF